MAQLQFSVESERAWETKFFGRVGWVLAFYGALFALIVGIISDRHVESGLGLIFGILFWWILEKVKKYDEPKPLRVMRWVYGLAIGSWTWNFF